MTKHVARYAVTFGLAGCYLPNSGPNLTIAHTRRDLANYIRDELRNYDLPMSLFNDVHITRLWHIIKRHGSSSAHFSLYHKQYSLCFSGLTEAEASELEASEEM